MAPPLEMLSKAAIPIALLSIGGATMNWGGRLRGSTASWVR